MGIFEVYVNELSAIKKSGAATPETSYYTAFANMLNAIGDIVNPPVKCIMNICNAGAGLPDGGLFTIDQLKGFSDGNGLPQLPACGAIEIKSTVEDIVKITETRQISRYWEKYGQVIVTNYRDYLLIGTDNNGDPKLLESYSLANTEDEFWKLVHKPNKLISYHGDSFIEFLKRTIINSAKLHQPSDIAWLLASYAKHARAIIDRADVKALQFVRDALEITLSLKFEGKKGEHFFRSTLVQTLFYGLFSAWVLWSQEKQNHNKEFNWREAAWSLQVPIIKALFEQMGAPSRLELLGVVEVLTWAANSLNRINRQCFFEEFKEENAIQYFYEPFLEAFDPVLRKDLGVWYTPREVVQYQVEKVDRALREELNIEDGLADKRVFVLDPCCGTGAYLSEILMRIAATHKNKGSDALTASDLKDAALNRIYGFEIMPAPFIISHLQIGLLLHKLGAPLSKNTSERAGIYLTNALTDWEPRKDPKTRLPFPELEEEHEAADKVKQEAPILVIIGNPPYNAYAGISSKEEHGLVEVYKQGLTSKWGIKKYNLDDLYVRFLRLAERRIAESGEKGIVCYITNFSYLRGKSFTVMREHLMKGFNKGWIDCLNGDSRETGKLTPSGLPDPSIFSTKYNREGIRTGTAISLWVKKECTEDKFELNFRHFWGSTKREELLNTLQNEKANPYSEILPTSNKFCIFYPMANSLVYSQWPSLHDICQEKHNGLMEKRKGALISINRDDLSYRMKQYFNPEVDWSSLEKLTSGLTVNASGYEAKKVREKAISTGQFREEAICQYLVRPFDVRWCFYSDVGSLWNRSRPDLWQLYQHKVPFLITRPSSVTRNEGIPFFFTENLGDNDAFKGHAYYAPMLTLDKSLKPRANLSNLSLNYLEKIGVECERENSNDLIWMHILATGFTPNYLEENAEYIRSDWPRVPFPNNKNLLVETANLGRQIAELLKYNNEIKGVTSGNIKSELVNLCVITKLSGSLNAQTIDLSINTGWGSRGADNAVMPGKGKIVKRQYTEEELRGIEKGLSAKGVSLKTAIDSLGNLTYDIYLNKDMYWKCVPLKVWEFRVGGYQVLKKWLSYREFSVLGRPITKEEAREFTIATRRIASIVFLSSQLNQKYKEVKSQLYDWQSNF